MKNQSKVRYRTFQLRVELRVGAMERLRVERSRTHPDTDFFHLCLAESALLRIPRPFSQVPVVDAVCSRNLVQCRSAIVQRDQHVNLEIGYNPRHNIKELSRYNLDFRSAQFPSSFLHLSTFRSLAGIHLPSERRTYVIPSMPKAKRIFNNTRNA